MKKYYTKLLKLVSDYSEWLQQQEQKKKNLDELFKGLRIAGETRNKEKKAIDDSLVASRAQFMEDVKNLHDEALPYIEKHYGINGGALTADAQLFMNDRILFTQKEIDRYCVTYKANPSMLRVISSYCDRHNLTSGGIMSAEEYYTHWKKLCDDAASAGMRSGLYIAILEKTLKDAIEHAPCAEPNW